MWPERKANFAVAKPKPSPKHQAELRRMHKSGNYSIVDISELFTVSRPYDKRVPAPGSEK
ncbi:MAG: hypothetical protein ACRDSP_13425 [Pseudonocardiaceae bacterium]